MGFHKGYRRPHAESKRLTYKKPTRDERLLKLSYDANVGELNPLVGLKPTELVGYSSKGISQEA